MSSIQFDHIAVGVHRLSDAAELLAGELGGRPFEGGPGPGYRGAQWEFDSGARLEAIEPVGPADGFLHRFLAQKGPGIHHVTFIVPDLRAAAARASSLGYAIVGYQDTSQSWKEAFLHPKRAMGIVVQMAQKGPKGPPSDGEWSSRFAFPTVTSQRVAPARIVGLRLAARDLDVARRQWCELLGGKEARSADRGGAASEYFLNEASEDGLLVFRWDNSPMRIAVELTAADSEGPRGIEIDERRAVGGMPTHLRTGVRLLHV